MSRERREIRSTETLMPQYLKRRQLWRCNWCQTTFLYKEESDKHDCAVKAAVQRAEVQGGRPLTFAEVKTVRDRARKEIAMAKEFGRA